MATKLAVTCKMVKKGGLKALVAAHPAKKLAAGAMPHAAEVTGEVQDDGSLNFHINFLDTAGNKVTVDPAAWTLADVSSDTTVITCDPMTGVTGVVHAAATTPPPAIGAKAEVTTTATATAGSPGPFTVPFGCTIKPGPISGIGVELDPTP